MGDFYKIRKLGEEVNRLMKTANMEYDSNNFSNIDKHKELLVNYKSRLCNCSSGYDTVAAVEKAVAIEKCNGLKSKIKTIKQLLKRMENNNGINANAV